MEMLSTPQIAGMDASEGHQPAECASLPAGRPRAILHSRVVGATRVITHDRVRWRLSGRHGFRLARVGLVSPGGGYKARILPISMENCVSAATNCIKIYGPKGDGTYVVEFRTAGGDVLSISIPRNETGVIRHFQERASVRLGWTDRASDLSRPSAAGLRSHWMCPPIEDESCQENKGGPPPMRSPSRAVT